MIREFNIVRAEPTIVETPGNKELLKLHKVAFLCSRNVPAAVVLKCFDWAIAQREAGKCVISGFYSRLEKDVLAYLERGTDPTGGKEFVGTRWNNGYRTLAAQKAAIGALP